MFDIDKAPIFPILVAVGIDDNAPNAFSFSDPSELTLSMPYPLRIVEDILSLRVNHTSTEDITPNPGR